MSRFPIREITLVVLLWFAATAAAQPKPPFGKLPPLPDLPSLGTLPDNLPDIPALIKLLTSGNDAERLAAAERIHEFGRAAKGAAAALLKSVEDGNENVRLASLLALGTMASEDKEALAKVRKRMEETDSEFERVLSAWAIARMSGDKNDVAATVTVLAKSLRSKDEAVASEAANALAELGSAAEPTLIDALDDKSSRVRTLAAGALGTNRARAAVSQLAGLLDDDSPLVRATAARSLGQIGPAASASSTALLGKLESDESTLVRANAAGALGRIGSSTPETIQVLTKTATDPAERVAASSLRALNQLNVDAEKVIPLLVKLLADPRPNVASAATNSLADIGKPAVPALSKAVLDKRSRYWAVLALSDMGAAAKPATGVLADALDEASADVQVEILLTLANIGPDAKESIAKIVPSLSSKYEGVRYAATFAVAQIGVKDRAAEQALETNASSSDAFLKLISSWALAKLNPRNPLHGARAIRALISSLASKDPRLQQAASMAAGELELGPAAIPQLLPNIFSAFKSSNEDVRESAVAALSNALSKVPAEPVLERAMENPQLRQMALRVVERLGPRAKGIVPVISKALDDSASSIRRDAALALAAIGPAASESVPALVERLKDDAPEVRWSATYALGSIGRDAADAKEPLRAIVGGTDESIKPITAWALAQLSPRDPTVATEIVPVLIQALRSTRIDDRLRSANALGQLGKQAASALGELEYASRDPNPSVRRAATTATNQIKN